MKRIIVLLIIFTMIFSSCSVIKERKNDRVYEDSKTLNINYSTLGGRFIKPALYFVQKGSGKLSAQLRTIIVRDNENPVKTIVQELLNGPREEVLSPISPSGVSVDYVEVSLDVANVYLLTTEELDYRQRFLIKLAITNTLADYLNIKYANVFFNGKSEGLSGYPRPLQNSTSGIWTEKYDELIGKYVASESEEQDLTTIRTIDVPLYFFDASSEYILPEVRDIEFEDDNFAQKILEELTKGPRNSYVYLPSVNQELSFLQEPEIIENEDKRTLYLNLSNSPAHSKFEKKEDELKSYICLIYTLTSFYPDIDDVIIDIEGTRVTVIGTEIDISSGVKRKDLSGYLANSVSLFFRIKDTNLLMKVNRMVSQQSVWSADVRLYELLLGPKSSDGDVVWPCFPKGIDKSDIMGTKTIGTTLHVNLSQNFKNKCIGLSHQEEMLLVFSMVNTLTQMQGINSVQFTVEDKRSDVLAGHLYFSDLFIKNPGLVQIDY